MCIPILSLSAPLFQPREWSCIFCCRVYHKVWPSVAPSSRIAVLTSHLWMLICSRNPGPALSSRMLTLTSQCNPMSARNVKHEDSPLRIKCENLPRWHLSCHLLSRNIACQCNVTGFLHSFSWIHKITILLLFIFTVHISQMKLAVMIAN